MLAMHIYSAVNYFSIRRPNGFTIVEAMVATLLGSIVLGGVILLAARVSIAAGDAAGASRLNQQSRMVMDYIARDLQRAGYVNWYQNWDDCLDSSTPNVLDDINADGAVDIIDFYQCSMPAIDLIGDISLWNFPVTGDAGSGTPTPCNSNCDCILFSYDFDKDGKQGIGDGIPGANQNSDNFELYGFRWNDESAELRIGGVDHRCDSGSWRDLNDTYVDVSALSFSLVYATNEDAGDNSSMFKLTGNGNWDGQLRDSCTPLDSDSSDVTPVAGDTVCLLSRAIDVSIQTRHASDPGIGLTLSTTVKNKNDSLELL